MISPSSPAPHPRSRRIPRKPPPAVDLTERYPSPDPLNPFAPLWVLRNRTSSALHESTHSPYFGTSDGSQETLNNRTLPDSCSPETTTEAETSYYMVSPPESVPKRLHQSHYTPYSEKPVNIVGTLQAFPRIPTPTTSQTNIDLASLPNNESPQFRDEPDLTDTDSTNASESDDASEIINPSLKISSTYLHLQQTLPNTIAKLPTPATENPAPVLLQKSNSNRFTRFLLPKKTSSLIGGGERRIPVATSLTHTRRASAAEFRRVVKSSISAPQGVASTHNSKNNWRRAPTAITTSLKNTDVTQQGVRGHLDKRDASHSHNQGKQGWPPENNQAAQKFVPMEEVKNRAHHRNPVSRSLSVPLPSQFTSSSLSQPQDQQHTLGMPASEMYSTLPAPLSLSPVQPSKHSISKSSIMDISISAPSFASNPSKEILGDGVFTHPRPAPRPPTSTSTSSTSPMNFMSAKGDARHSEPICCSSTGEATTTVPPSAELAKPTPNAHLNSNPNPLSFPTEWALPTPHQIAQAASLPLTCEDGSRLPFGSLFATARTIVIFIRHFWCPLCQDYMSSLKSVVRREMLSAWPAGEGENVDNPKARLVSFVVIGNGAHGMIPKYKQIFGLPFTVYTDPELAIYKALGMGRDGDGHLHLEQKEKQQQPQRKLHKQKPLSVASLSDSPDLEFFGNKTKAAPAARQGGGYVKHGLMSGIAMVVVRAIKVGMPVWEKGGDIGQLGGEFIFGPGLTCSFAHRMQTTKGHAPIQDVLTAAGINVDANARVPNKHTTPPPPKSITDLLALHPPTPTPPPKNPGRKRLSSLKSLRDAFPRPMSRGGSTSSKVAEAPVSGTGTGGSNFKRAGGNGHINISAPSRRHSKSLSMGMFVGVMSREEEDRWMEQRQLSIERLREKKNIRRGMLGRALSTQSYRTPHHVSVHEVLSGQRGGEVGAVRPPIEEKSKLVEEERWQSEGKIYWEPMGEENDEAIVSPPRQTTLESMMTDSASSHSTTFSMPQAPTAAITIS